jgi:predicted O-methyltransferase YrrM
VTVLPSLLKAYEDEGFIVSTGLNSNHFFDSPAGPLTWLLDRDRNVVFTSAGIAFDEVLFLDSLVQSLARPVRSVLIIGNMFGWSAIALALICKGAKVVAVDNLEAPGSVEGRALTRRIAERLGLDVTTVKGTSPQDVASVHAAHFDGPIDLVFIDGLHTDDQIVRDFQACQAVGDDQTMYLFHDIVAFLMLRGFDEIAAAHQARTQILFRTSTGMAVALPAVVSAETRILIDTYSGSVDAVEAMFYRSRQERGQLGSAYAPFIEQPAACWPPVASH